MSNKLEQPLSKLTNGKLREIEKVPTELEKALTSLIKLNKTLSYVSKRPQGEEIGTGEQRINRRVRSTGNPMSGRGGSNEDSRLTTTGGGTVSGFKTHGGVKGTLPYDPNKKQSPLLAHHGRQAYGESPSESKLIDTKEYRDVPNSTGALGLKHGMSSAPVPPTDDSGKDSATPLKGLPVGQSTKPTNVGAGGVTPPKQGRARKFLNRLMGKKEKQPKKLTQGTSAVPNTTPSGQTNNQTFRSSNYQNKPSGSTASSAFTHTPSTYGSGGATTGGSGKKQSGSGKKTGGSGGAGATTGGKKGKPKGGTGASGNNPFTKQKEKLEKLRENGGSPQDQLKRGLKRTAATNERKIQNSTSATNELKRKLGGTVLASKKYYKRASIIKAIDRFFNKDNGTGYGDLFSVNSYASTLYNDETFIGSSGSKNITPINDRETYILTRQNKGNKNE